MMTQNGPDDNTSIQIGNMPAPDQFQQYSQSMQSFPASIQPTRQPVQNPQPQFQAPLELPAQNQQPISHNLFIAQPNPSQMPLRTMPNQQPTSEQQAALDAAMQQNAILSLTVPSGPPPAMNMGHEIQMPIRNMMQGPASLYPSPPDDQHHQQHNNNNNTRLST